MEDKIVDCFRNGGGVPYSEYPDFQSLQAEETSRVFDSRLIDQIVPLTGKWVASVWLRVGLASNNYSSPFY